jgi:predicted metal-binding protein
VHDERRSDRHEAPLDRSDEARRVRDRWATSAVLVCRECDGARGFGPKQVRKQLRRDVKDRLPRRSARVLAVECMGECPKHAVTVAVAGPTIVTATVSGRDGCAAVIDEMVRGAEARVSD